jgi:hypothetical protein
LPRFFGITKTFSPVFRVPEAPDELDALVVVVLAGAELDEELLLHAASVADAARSTAGASSVLLSEGLIFESFQF